MNFVCFVKLMFWIFELKRNLFHWLYGKQWNKKIEKNLLVKNHSSNSLFGNLKWTNLNNEWNVEDIFLIKIFDKNKKRSWNKFLDYKCDILKVYISHSTFICIICNLPFYVFWGKGFIVVSKTMVKFPSTSFFT